MSEGIVYISKIEAVSMADEWFEIATEDHFWMKWRFNCLMKYKHLFKENSEFKVLEIGCGNGVVMNQFRFETGIPIDGCDLNEGALKLVNQGESNLFLYNIYDTNKELINKYDAIFLFDVIEHIDNDSDFVAKALEHGKDGGLLFINVPALKALFSKYDVQAGHIRRYNKRNIEDLLNKLDLEIIDVQYWGLSLIPIAILRKIYLIFVPAKKIIDNGFKPPSRFINELLILLMKIELRLIRNNKFLGTSLMAVARKKGN